jgi:hypothetical protein
MLKKIALVTVFALGAAFGTAAARAATLRPSAAKKVPAPTAPQGLCPPGMPWCWPALPEKVPAPTAPQGFCPWGSIC